MLKNIPERFYVEFKPVSQSVPFTYTSWGAFICDRNKQSTWLLGREYISATGYVEQLAPDNRRSTDDKVRAEAAKYGRAVVDPDISPKDFPVPAKTQFILDALNDADVAKREAA